VIITSENAQAAEADLRRIFAEALVEMTEALEFVCDWILVE